MYEAFVGDIMAAIVAPMMPTDAGPMSANSGLMNFLNEISLNVNLSTTTESVAVLADLYGAAEEELRCDALEADELAADKLVYHLLMPGSKWPGHARDLESLRSCKDNVRHFRLDWGRKPRLRSRRRH